MRISKLFLELRRRERVAIVFRASHGVVLYVLRTISILPIDTSLTLLSPELPGLLAEQRAMSLRS